MKIPRWLPAAALMTVIFIFSATPSYNLPDYGLWDTLVKKSAHVTEYALLALAYWYWLGFDSKKGWLAWLLTVGYAATDEFHQSFTSGRHPTAFDVLIFDNLGALLAVLVTTWVRRKQKSYSNSNSNSSSTSQSSDRSI